MVRPEEGELISTLGRLRRDALAIYRAALQAVAAPRLLSAALDQPRIADFVGASPVHLVAAGKSAAQMASALVASRRVGLRRAIAVGTHCPVPLASPVEWHRAGHPVPDGRSLDAGARVLDLARGVGADERLLVLLSGGASSLVSAPVDPVSLDEKRRVTAVLLAAGADIHALNSVRKHLSRVKGGWLAASCAGSTLALAISDVVGDDPSVIGSGPAVADPSWFDDALGVVDRFGGRGAYPRAVVAYLEAGSKRLVSETPKPGDARLARASTVVIGSRHDAMEGARRAAQQLGYDASVLQWPVVGEARVAAGRHLAAALDEAGRRAGPACVISSGETTVTVAGPGRGGRNQEFALASASPLSAEPGSMVILSAGTDGVDGPTEAAGAIVDTSTLARARAKRLDAPEAYLHANDSHAFFRALDDLVVTGPTDTNVGDLQILLTGGEP